MFPKPRSVTSFITILLKKLAHPLVGYDIKADICRVVKKLLQYHEAHNSDTIYSVTMEQLRGPPLRSTKVDIEKKFVIEGLKLLLFLNKMDSKFAVFLMLHYIEGDEELREQIMEYFFRHKLKDPVGYFKTAVINIPKFQRGAWSELSATSTVETFLRCQEWMDYWTEEYRLDKYSKTLHSKKPARLVCEQNLVLKQDFFFFFQEV